MYNFLRINMLCTVAFFIASGNLYAADNINQWPGAKSQWNGYDCYDFSINDVTDDEIKPDYPSNGNCKVVVPKRIAEGRPWIWRARFWGHEPQTDLALLEQGYHVVFCDVANLFGSPRAVKLWDTFYDYLTKNHAMSKRPALEGMSRGGLVVLNWAIANPGKVSCLYVDAPVCDIRSWPGGKGAGKGSRGDWQKCLAVYSLTEEQSTGWKGGPLDNLKPLAEQKVPILSICGAADDVVPMRENTDILAERYEKQGGSIRVISKPGVGHHPHSLKDPTTIVEFVLKHAEIGGKLAK